MKRTELELVRDGEVARVVVVGASPLRVGRQLDNDLILAAEDVSGNHAVLSAREGGLLIRDLKSTNGTWVNGGRIAGEVLLVDGDEVRLGLQTVLRVRQVAVVPGRSPLTVRDIDGSTVHLVREDRVTFGCAAGSTFEYAQGYPRAATLMFDDDEIWLDTHEEAARAVVPGELFTVAGRRYVVEPAALADATIAHRDATRYPYRLLVTMDGPGGATARMCDPSTGAEHLFGAENRSTLLYVLARKRAADLAAGVATSLAGWMDDDEVVVAVWGRAALRQATSNYSVLLHRIRREAEGAGFDPAFLEKRRGAARVRLDALTVE